MLTTELFADAVRKGMGRAVLAVNGPVNPQFEEIILAACLQDQRYDRQCEDNRSDYLMLMVERAGLTEKLHHLVVKPIEDSLDDWDRLMRIRMIGQFTDDTVALTMLRDLALAQDTDAWETLADYGHIDWVAEHIVPTMPDDEKWRIGVWLDEHPNAPCAEQLKAIQEEEEKHRPAYHSPREVPSFDQVLSNIHSGRGHGRDLKRIGKTLSKQQVRTVANLWLNEVDERKGRQFACLFQVRDFPLPVEFVIDRVRMGKAPTAFQDVIGQLNDPKIREFGLNILQQSEPDILAYACLLGSFLNEDITYLTSRLDAFVAYDEWDLHSLGFDLRNLAKKLPLDDRPAFLTWVYEYTPCSMCRGSAAKIMIDDGTLPETYRQEIQFDSDSYARELALK